MVVSTATDADIALLLQCGCVESGHLTLVSGAGEGEVVSKKVGKEVRGAQG